MKYINLNFLLTNFSFYFVLQPFLWRRKLILNDIKKVISNLTAHILCRTKTYVIVYIYSAKITGFVE